ncbi:MAG: sugar ABC transporter permease [Chloroflexi bacterium]|nr:sugar ABC transporter permease [Chloroflexota bacterium]
MRRALLPYAFVAPAVIVMAALMVFPMGRMIHMSLFQDLFSRVGEQFVGFENYADLFQKELFWVALANSIIFVVASLIIHQIVGGGLALLLTSRMRGSLRTFFRAIFITPWLIIPAVVAITWVLLLDHRGGFNSMLRSLGIVECCPPPEWFGDFKLAMPALIATNGWGGYPLTMIMWLAGLQSIPKDHYEAASVDGAGRWRRFRHITLPAMGPTILTILLLDTIYTFRNWDLPFLTTGGGPGDTTMVLPLLTYREAFIGFNFGISAASAVMILVITAFFVFWFLRIRGRLLEG